MHDGAIRGQAKKVLQFSLERRAAGDQIQIESIWPMPGRLQAARRCVRAFPESGPQVDAQPAVLSLCFMK
jgi:hypothetical protein